MGDPNNSENWWQGIGKVLIYFVFVLIGITVTVAMNIEKAVVSWRAIILEIVYGLCAGAMASFACYGWKFHVGVSALVIPSATMLGQKLFNWIDTGGWEIIKSWLPAWMKQKKKDE